MAIIKQTGTIIGFIVTMLFAITASAQTEKKDDIDIAYETCVAKDTSTANIGACAFVAYGKWDKELENAYKKLQKQLKMPKDKAALKQSQAAWKSYRDAEFTTYDNMFNCPGSGCSLLRHNGKIDIVRTRVLQSRAYAEAIKQLPAKDVAPRKKKH